MHNNFVTSSAIAYTYEWVNNQVVIAYTADENRVIIIVRYIISICKNLIKRICHNATMLVK